MPGAPLRHIFVPDGVAQLPTPHSNATRKLSANAQAYVRVEWKSGGITMRKPTAMVIILAGLVLLILAHGISDSGDFCGRDPSFFERGTYADCEARNQRQQTPHLVADAEDR
jgi:hypothetical protein